MFRLFSKLAIVTLVFLGAAMFTSSGHAAADSCMPNPPGNNWGVTVGENAGALAGLRVHAYNGSYTNGSGNPNNGLPINTSYTLNSSNSRGDARIFLYPPNTAFQYSSRTFNTGEVFYDGSNTQNCDGWSVLGPGKAIPVPDNPSDPNSPVHYVDQWGNHYILDCAQGDESTNFTITKLAPPSNQPGYWEIQVNGSTNYGVDGGTPNLSTTAMTPFHVKNGATKQLNLIWHPQYIPPPQETATCTGAHIEDDKRTNGSGKHSYTYVTISGVDNPQTNYNIGWGDSHDFRYHATEQYVNVRVQRFFVGQGNPYYDHTDSYHCYHASCSIQQIINDGSSPPGTVLAGHQFTLQIQVQNDNHDPNAETVPDPYPDSPPGSVSNYYFSITEEAENGHGYIQNNTNFSLQPPGPYDTGTLFVNMTAPANAQNFNVSFYPELWGGGKILGDHCGNNIGGGIRIYEPFSIQALPPASQLIPTDENPSQAVYHTDLVLSFPQPGETPVNVCVPTTNEFYKLRGATKSLLDSSSWPWCPPGGTYAPGQTTWRGNSPYNVPPGFIGGDQYCARLRLGYTSGYVGPGGPTDIINVGSESDQSSCDKVTNKPYFRALGSGVSAGLALKNSSGTCNTASGGLLAGWNNNSGGQERGAGSQLSALALVKITGFASAQTNILRSATDLTFANKGAGVSVNSGSEDPDLGGSFSPSGYCVNDVAPPSSGGGSTTLPGGSSYNGNPNVTGSQSIFVNGDVTITNNVVFGPTGSIATAPSFVLHATGNIKIAPNVTRLDGMYVSDQNIYTCDTASANVYATCNNQLLVHGSFVAAQVKLQRTFGSLRDEEPNPPAATPPGPPTSWGVRWTNWGDSPYSNPPSLASLQSAGYSCRTINEGAEPNASTWWDNYLCAPGASGLRFAWTSWDDSPDFSDPDSSSSTTINLNAIKAKYPYCVQWDVSAVDPYTWGDNTLCANKDVHMTFGNTPDGRDCTNIKEDSDPSGQWASGYWLCMDKQPGAPSTTLGPPTPKGPPYTCSNAGAYAFADHRTCAAEVFELGPELYLSTPSIQLPNGGAPPWDAVTGLPPVL